MAQTPAQTTPTDDDSTKSGSVAYRIIRGMFVVLFFWIFWKFGGFLLNAIVGRVYGAGAESDAYFFAAQSVVYLLIFSRMMNILIPSFTPIFIEEKNERGEEEAWKFVNTTVNLLMVAAAGTMILFYVYAEPITGTLVRGFGDEARYLGIKLLRWIMPGAAMMMMYLPMRALLNSYKTFSYPSAAEAVQKLAWAVGLYVTYYFFDMGLAAIAIGFLVGTGGMIAVSLYGMRHHLQHYRFRLPSLRNNRLVKEVAVAAVFLTATIALLHLVNNSLPANFEYTDVIQLGIVLLAAVGFTGQLWLRARNRSGVMARFALLAAPLLISTGFSAFRDVVTYYFQSFTARGVFSDIEFARHIVFVPTTVVAYALSVAMFPYLCELASDEDHTMLGRIITKTIRMLSLGFIPLTVMTIILADPVSRLVFDRGDWAQLHLNYTALALALLAIGLVVYACEYVIMQGYYSLQRMWAPAIMGIIATFFQFGFLAIPIYVFDYSYPVQIFYLAALAFPVSRYFKNLILLGMLRRHVPVLPVRPTLIFAGKLIILTAAVGAATWFGHRYMKTSYPFAPYRQHKVVVDNFETGPDTWFSLNAAELGIAQAPQREGLSLKTRYDRHGNTGCSVYRRTPNLAFPSSIKLTFSAYSAAEPGRIALELEKNDERYRVLEQDMAKGQWTRHSAVIENADNVDKLQWLEIDSPPTENVLYLDDVQVLDPETDAVLWEDDFDSNGWTGPTTPTAEDTKKDSGSSEYALRLAADSTTQRDISAYDLSETTLFRCRLLNESDAETTVNIELSSDEQKVTEEITLSPDRWTTLARTGEELGFESAEAFRGVDRISVDTSGKAVYLDDITFRRPPRRMYELVKFLHCVVATLAGLFAGAIALPLLRFEETSDVIEWVKAKGWQKSEEELEEELSGPN